MKNNLTNKVVIIGRANVGKSTLFNRLAGKRLAMISNIAGTTRDLKYAEINWLDNKFTLIDTGGWLTNPKTPLKVLSRQEKKKLAKQQNNDGIDKQVEKYARLALKEAGIIIFLVDAKSGLNPQDRQIANFLKRQNKKIILTINKCDNPQIRQQTADFYKLGLGEPILLSAANGSGSGDLLDTITKELKLRNLLKKEKTDTVEKKSINVALLGKPNVGKSSLLNKLIGYDKAIVSSIAHTTREPNNETIFFKDKQIILVDTAGIRRKAKVNKSGLENLGIKMSIKALRQASIALLLLDLSQTISHQDLQLANLVLRSNSAAIIVANKYDLLKNEQPNDQKLTQKYTNFIYDNFPHLKFAPIIFVSAKNGLNVKKILDLILEVDEQNQIKVNDNALNKFLKRIIKQQPPPKKRIGFGKKTKIKRSFITNFKQIDIIPPLFECTIGSKEKLPENYRRYILNKLRDKFGFKGVPIKLVVRYKKELNHT